MAAWLLLVGCVAVHIKFEAHYFQEHCDEEDWRNQRNLIMRENCLPGSPSTEWDINGDGDPSIQGFGHDISVLPGEEIVFKIKTDSNNYRVDIYRLGFYRGNGARKVATISPEVQLPQLQPPCFTDNVTHLYDCGNWHPSARWNVPADAVSGLYIARPVRQDSSPPSSWRADNSQYGSDPRFAKPSGNVKPVKEEHAYGALGVGELRNPLREPRASHIYFVVRREQSNDGSLVSDILFQTSDTTWQAYNHYGGTSTYGSYDPENPRPRSFESSYNRPLATRQKRAINAPLAVEYPLIRFLESNAYDVSYQAGLDTHRQPEGFLATRHKVFLSVGHDEYWSGKQRFNVHHARDQGLNLGFLSGNEMFWRVRWSESRAGGESNGGLRTMVCYKESQSDVKLDPEEGEWTGTFRDGRAINPRGAEPESWLTGLMFTANAWRNDPLLVPFRFSRLRMWRHTLVAHLTPNDVAVFPRILGHEWDEDVQNGARPTHGIRLSETAVDNVMYIMDHGSVYDSGSATHHLLYYRAASGALVFSVGTVQWAWALDPHHDLETGAPANMGNILNTRVGEDLSGAEPDLQQLTVNILEDMGVIPDLPASHLSVGSYITDTSPPVSRLLADPESSSSLGWEFSAEDEEGDVGAVEVSFNRGVLWWAATRVSLEKWVLKLSDSRATPEALNTIPKSCHDVCWRAIDDLFNVEAMKCQSDHLEL